MLINKKDLWVLSVIFILLSLVFCNKAKIENVNDDYILQVTAFIDGRDRLHITRAVRYSAASRSCNTG